MQTHTHEEWKTLFIDKKLPYTPAGMPCFSFCNLILVLSLNSEIFLFNEEGSFLFEDHYNSKQSENLEFEVKSRKMQVVSRLLSKCSKRWSIKGNEGIKKFLS